MNFEERAAADLMLSLEVNDCLIPSHSAGRCAGGLINLAIWHAVATVREQVASEVEALEDVAPPGFDLAWVAERIRARRKG